MKPLRGTVVWPLSPTEALFLEDGVVDPALPEPRPAQGGDGPRTDGLIVPAFADWHLHWVQLGICGVRPESLLAWLRTTAWPEEERFADAEVCAREAPLAVERLRAVGTLAGSAWGSPHGASAAAFLDAAPAAFRCGPAAMTIGPPESLRRQPDEVVRDLEVLAAAYAGRAVVTPRFALSCDAGTLAHLGRAAERLRLPVQTHLAETEEEIEAVRRLHPGARDYTEVYERAGLLGAGTLLAHAIHVSDEELARIAAAAAVVVHCPTSNLALGSGRMPLGRMRAAGVRWALGSDVGAGPDPNLLDVIDAAVRLHAGRLTAVEAFHRASIGPAALDSGRSEAALSVAERPGALVYPRPPGAAGTDPEVWLRCLASSGETGSRSVPRAVRAFEA